MRNKQPVATHTYEALAKSRLFADYRRAFENVTGVALTITPPGQSEDPNQGCEQVPEFCRLMSRHTPAHAACCAAHHNAHKEEQAEAWTFTCFAGLCETVVPVRIGGLVMAWLRPGRAMTRPPRASAFGKIADMFSGWDTDSHLRAAKDAWLGTRVIPAQQYEALVGLIIIFAKHLAACVPLVSQSGTSHEYTAIERARLFIAERFPEKLTLSEVSRVACMSSHYFSGKFKAVTGMGFVEYLARTRVDRACDFLRDPRMSITDVAFEAGFRSLSQFNRTFRQLMNQSPSEYRAYRRAAI